MKEIDTVVIGGGQAGLSTSFWLKQHGISHVVLERGEVGESWRSQRWDSFTLNTPNHLNILPGEHIGPQDENGFWNRDELVVRLEQYAAKCELPIAPRVAVTAVNWSETESAFIIDTSRDSYLANRVVVASGSQNQPKISSMQTQISPTIHQIHAADYRSADQLPEGAVLVVGSAQSGVQIAESLVESGRDVYLSTSKVGRVRRRYRGKDLTEWAVITGMAEQTIEDLDDPAQAKAPQPQISGRHGGETLSLQSLEARGVVLLGRLASYQEGLFHFSDNLPENINFADQVSQEFCKTLDDTI
ncbi:MAG: NAD(P)/FAD-dependent oxidoreductase, partial [Gammaproteobacteria bacterium]|nr:NAD(P)/FAD-dependent oxidoreductase [Gammaproteobacteria bacterium]